MVTGLRRRVSRVLARWAVRMDPDPPLTFTLKRRIDTPEMDRFLADLISGKIVGHGRIGK